MSRPRPAERPGLVATTAHAQAAYPFLACASLGAPGPYIGRDAYGGSFLYDPWELYRRGTLPGQNMIVAGKIGRRKSTLVKSYLYRQRVFGRRAWVIDVKGEYGPLAEASGGTRVRLEPGGEVRLNPLSPRGGTDTQLSLLRSVAKAALRRELEPEEDAGLRVALECAQAERRAAEPTLPDVVEVLLRPREQMISGVMAKDAESFAAENRALALALQRLCAGDLRGMFDGPTSAEIDLDAPLVVLDLSAMRDSAALGVLMTCAAAWLQAAMIAQRRAAEAGEGPGRQLILVIEEGWRVTSHIGVAEWLQETFKLCRSLGVQVIVVLHHLSDLGSSSAAGSREARIAESLIADTDTIVLYALSHDQMPDTAARLALPETAAQIVPTLRLGEALWIVGQHLALVQHRISAAEAALVDTDARIAAER